MYLLDTNICIYAIKNKPAQVSRRVKENMNAGLCISAITLAELEYGIQKSAKPEKNRSALMDFLSILKILPFDRARLSNTANCAPACKRRALP